jgi:hypothetical protein
MLPIKTKYKKSKVIEYGGEPLIITDEKDVEILSFVKGVFDTYAVCKIGNSIKSLCIDYLTIKKKT